MVLVQQWNWYFDNHADTTASDSSALSKKNLWREFNQLSAIRSELISISQSNYNPWQGEFGNELYFSVDSSIQILGINLLIKFDPDVLQIKEINNETLSKINGFNFQKADESKGEIFTIN